MKRNKLGRIIIKIYTVIMVIALVFCIPYIFHPPIPDSVQKKVNIIMVGGCILLIIGNIEKIVLIKKDESKDKKEKREAISTQIKGIILYLIIVILFTKRIKTIY